MLVTPPDVKFDMIVACDVTNGGIGKNGTLPWSIPPDMYRFRYITTHTTDTKKKNIVIMGRKTYDSLPFSGGLPNRINIVLSRSPFRNTGITNSQRVGDVSPNELTTLNPNTSTMRVPMTCTSLQSALILARHLQVNEVAEHTFIIGGHSIYNEALHTPGLNKVHVTLVSTEEHHDYDVFFPIEKIQGMHVTAGSDWREHKGIRYKFACYHAND